MIPTSLVTIANPSAGNGFTVNVPAGQEWLVRALRASFVANATVANRVPYLSFTLPGGTSICTIGCPVNLVASSTTIITWGIDSPSAQSAWTTLVSIYIPKVWLPGGSSIQVNANNLQVGDQFSGIALAVERG